MLDKLLVNIKTVLPITRANNERRYKTGDQLANDESTLAFIERATADANGPHADRTPMNYLRSYFSQFARRKSAPDIDNTFMLPRVFEQPASTTNDWDPVELKPKEKFIEDIDNVIDKFSRVISVTETQSPRRNKYFYVYNGYFDELQLF